MTTPTNYPTVEIDGRDWPKEKRVLWRAIQTFAHEVTADDEEQVDLDSEIAPVCVGLSYELYPHLSDHDREVLCVDVITELRSAFEMVASPPAGVA